MINVNADGIDPAQARMDDLMSDRLDEIAEAAATARLGCSLHGGVAQGTASGGTEWIGCSQQVCGHDEVIP